MGLFELEQARTVQEALAVAAGTGLPAQNFVVADREGRIGWTLIGPIPRRHGGDATRPVPWHRAGGPWDDWLEPADYPSIVDPPSGRLWTANNRVVGPPLLDALGDGGFDLGARARQIRDDLLELERATPADLLAVQLDDRALFLERWRELLLDVLDHDAVAADTRRAELRSWVAEGWSGRAAVGSVGYRLVRAFRLFLAEQVFDAITAPCRETDERFSYQRATNQWEQPLWELVTERPPHLLDPRARKLGRTAAGRRRRDTGPLCRGRRSRPGPSLLGAAQYRARAASAESRRAAALEVARCRCAAAAG